MHSCSWDSEHNVLPFTSEANEFAACCLNFKEYLYLRKSLLTSDKIADPLADAWWGYRSSGPRGQPKVDHQGSPLIDTATKRVVGVLTGGVSSCDTRSSPDYFGRISRVSS